MTTRHHQVAGVDIVRHDNAHHQVAGVDVARHDNAAPPGSRVDIVRHDNAAPPGSRVDIVRPDDVTADHTEVFEQKNDAVPLRQIFDNVCRTSSASGQHLSFTDLEAVQTTASRTTDACHRLPLKPTLQYALVVMHS